MSRIAHVVGFDDCPFAPEHRGDVQVVGAVYSSARLDGVLSGRMRRDGANATRVLTEAVRESQFADHLQAVMLQGIALAGFNVVDVPALHRALGLPVIVVARRQPDRAAVRRALLERVPGGRRKWALIEQLPLMRPAAGVWLQHWGLAEAEAEAVVERFAVHSRIPEPLRTAHLIAGGISGRRTRQRV